MTATTLPRPVKIDASAVSAQSSPQGQALTPIIHSGTAPGCTMSAGRVAMPAGAVSQSHSHPDSDIIICILDGYAATVWGWDMQPLLHGPGSMVWIPAGVPHAAINLSTSAGVLGIELRADPSFNDDTRLLPELDVLVRKHVERLRRDHAETVLSARVSGHLPSWGPDAVRSVS